MPTRPLAAASPRANVDRTRHGIRLVGDSDGKPHPQTLRETRSRSQAAGTFKPAESEQLGAAAGTEDEPDRRVQLWLRAKLGGERMTDLAREFGYRDGSGVLQVVKRLEARSAVDKAAARQLRELRAAFEVSVSNVDSAEKPL
jgi:hypothetical protein